MAYDVALERRIDLLADTWSGLAKRKMFGGIGYLLAGNLAFGIWKHSLMVRCGPERQAECLRERHTGRFDVTGRPMKGWLLVDPAGFATEAALRRWLTIGYEFASSLPEKPAGEFAPVAGLGDEGSAVPPGNMSTAKTDQGKDSR